MKIASLKKLIFLIILIAFATIDQCQGKARYSGYRTYTRTYVYTPTRTYVYISPSPTVYYYGGYHYYGGTATPMSSFASIIILCVFLIIIIVIVVSLKNCDNVIIDDGYGL